MQEKGFRQDIDNWIRRWIKDPRVIIEENPMEHNKKLIKIHRHQKRDDDRNDDCDLKWLDQRPKLTDF